MNNPVNTTDIRMIIWAKLENIGNIRSSTEVQHFTMHR